MQKARAACSLGRCCVHSIYYCKHFAMNDHKYGPFKCKHNCKEQLCHLGYKLLLAYPLGPRGCWTKKASEKIYESTLRKRKWKRNSKKTR